MATQFNEKPQAPLVIDPGEVHQALNRILASKHFSHAPKKQKFLRLLCDFYLQGNASKLNEYLIGREVFERTEEYNPSDDPIVRVGAHDVRKKLGLYYQTEGAGDEIRLEIPVGSYEPVFQRRCTTTDEISSPGFDSEEAHSEPGVLPGVLEDAPDLSHPLDLQKVDPQPAISEPALSPKRALGRAGWMMGLGVLLSLLVIIGLLIWDDWGYRRQVSAATESRVAAGGVWRHCLENQQPTLLVLSNPPVYRLVNPGDPETTVRSSTALTPEQAKSLTWTLQDNFAIRNTSPDPRLLLSTDTYTGMGEAIGLQRVTDLLRTTGESVVVKRSLTVSAEDLKDYSIVLFGSVWANEWSGKLPQTEDFVYTGLASIRNLNRQAGEAEEYRSKFDDRSGKLLEDYALITVKRSLSEDNFLMVLSGIRSAGTEAAAEYVTNKRFLTELNQQLSRMGSPRYYQTLLKVGVENGIPTTISPLTTHALRSN
jgi:hypothetical protein